MPPGDEKFRLFPSIKNRSAFTKYPYTMTITLTGVVIPETVLFAMLQNTFRLVSINVHGITKGQQKLNLT
jgi:hypothetical protein